MGTYIYKENTGTKIVGIMADSTPAKKRVFATIDGTPTPVDKQNYTLLETVSDINANAGYSTKGNLVIVYAMITNVMELGGGNIEAGFNLLSSAEKLIAANYEIGTAAQILETITSIVT